MGGGLSSSTPPISVARRSPRALDRAEVKPDEVEGVVYGQVLQAGQGQIPSRQAQIKAGIPREVPSRPSTRSARQGCAASGSPTRRSAQAT